MTKTYKKVLNPDFALALYCGLRGAYIEGAAKSHEIIAN
jgi:hypothetical protein